MADLMRIIILSAFQDELTDIINGFTNLKEITISKCRCLLGGWNEHDVYIALSGIGTSASAITTTILCENIKPDLIIFCGVAGGLKPDQQIGDLVLANKIIDADLHLLPTLLKDTPYKNALIDPHTHKNISAHYPVSAQISTIINAFVFENLKQGVIVTSNTFPAPKDLFEEIRQLDCSAIEMESAGIYKAAEYYNVPVITIRSISNLLDEFGNDLGTKPNALQLCAARLASCLTQLLTHINSHVIISDNLSDEVQSIVQKYTLSQHPEGGWYKRIFQSNDVVIAQGPASKRYGGEPRFAGTSILYLLERDDFSAWHSVQSDETWCFHMGEPLKLRVIDNSGFLQEITLGHDVGHLQFTVRAGNVFSAESLGKYSLVSCIVTPGFDFQDFQLIPRKEFITQYPHHQNLSKLCREDSFITDKKNRLTEVAE